MNRLKIITDYQLWVILLFCLPVVFLNAIFASPYNFFVILLLPAFAFLFLVFFHFYMFVSLEGSAMSAIKRHWRLIPIAIIAAPFFYILYFFYGFISFWLGYLFTLLPILLVPPDLVPNIVAAFLLLASFTTMVSLSGCVIALTAFQIFISKFSIQQEHIKLWRSKHIWGYIFGANIMFWCFHFQIRGPENFSMLHNMLTSFVIAFIAALPFEYMLRQLKKKHPEYWPTSCG